MHGNHHDLSTLSFYFMISFLLFFLSLYSKNHENEKKMHRTWLVILKSCTTQTRSKLKHCGTDYNETIEGIKCREKTQATKRKGTKLKSKLNKKKESQADGLRRWWKRKLVLPPLRMIVCDRDRRRETSNGKIRRLKNEKYLFKVQSNSVHASHFRIEYREPLDKL